MANHTNTCSTRKTTRQTNKNILKAAKKQIRVSKAQLLSTTQERFLQDSLLSIPLIEIKETASNNIDYPDNPTPPIQEVLRCASGFSGMGAVEEACKSFLNHANKWMIEIDKFAQKIFHANHKVEKSYTDIKEVDETKLAKVDLFTFGFPCTSYSTQGSRQGFLHKLVGTLVFDAFRIIQAQKMKYWVAENVDGLVNHDLPYEVDINISISEDDYANKAITPKTENKLWQKTVLADNTIIYYKRIRKGVEIDGVWYKKGYPSIFNPTEYDGIKKGIGHSLYVIEKSAQELGYKITWRVLNAKSFHTPQNRPRIFIVAIREDLDQEFTWPQESPVDSCVFDYMEDDVDYSEDILKTNTKNLVPHVAKRDTDIKKIWLDTSITYESERRVHSMAGISPCFLAGGARVKFWDEINSCFRLLSVSEIMRIQGFNKDFKLSEIVPRIHARKAVGNSISVPVITAILKNLIPSKYFLENELQEDIQEVQNDTIAPANNIVVKKEAVVATAKATLIEDSDLKPVNNTSNECLSVLRILKKRDGVSINRVKKGVKKLRKEAKERATKLIIENIDKPLTAKSMYINQALINYSKDQNLFDSLEAMDDAIYTKYLKDRSHALLNYDSFADDSDTRIFVPFQYAGGKQGGNKVAMQKLAKKAFANKKYKIWVDPFAGAFGATYNVIPVLLKNGVEEIVVNDINKSIINTYRHIQKSPKQVQRHLASIAIDYYKEFGKFAPETKEEIRALHVKLEAEFLELEIQRKMNARRAALFLVLISKAAGAMLDYDMEKKTCFFETSYIPLRIDLLINKVAVYNKIFNVIKTTFKSVKYQTILKTYAKDSTALLAIDSPYLVYSEVETEESCSYTYGIDFNHKELLNKLKNPSFDFIYYNNHNPLLENFASKHNYSYFKNERVFKNGVKGDTKTIEITMTNFDKKEVKQSDVEINCISANNINTDRLTA